MAAPHRDDAAPRPEAPHAAAPGADRLPPATIRARLQLGVLVLAVTVVAVVLVAGGAPPALRGPAVLVAATLLPGYPVVARLPVDIATLLALEVCVSLATEAAGAFLLVQTRFWHPQALALAVAGAGAGAALVCVTQLRRQLAEGRL